MAIARALIACWLVLSAALVARADTDLSAKEAGAQAAKAAIAGPYKVNLPGQATIDITAEMAFIPLPQASTLMKSWGNSVDENFKGLVVSNVEGLSWVVAIHQVKEGFVKDEDARHWDIAELLTSLKEGTAEQNKVRKKMGLPELEIVGWIQEPVYDAATHRLVWSLKAIDPNEPQDQVATVNYNTYALGRDGYFELNLLSNTDQIERDKESARTLLANFHYLPGKRYDDVDLSSDRIAEYGLAALIGGVAAKKLGLLALAGAFIAKFAKVLLVGAAILGGGVMKFFRRFIKPPA